MQVFRQQISTKLTDNAYFDAYVADNSEEIDPKRRRPAVVVCPGGGYAFCSDREAEPVAIQLLAKGYQVFVLYYSVGERNRFPKALLELASTVLKIRQNAEAWHVDPHAVIVAGFSAGGHLAASLGTLFAEPVLQDYDPEMIRPDGMLLGYPVITSGPLAHRGSFDNLIGKDPSEALLAQVSLEKHVTAQTPPAFIWATFNDDTVPVENSMMFSEALHKHGVDAELHLFPKGPHGSSLATRESINVGNGDQPNPQVAAWLDLFNTWMQPFVNY